MIFSGARGNYCRLHLQPKTQLVLRFQDDAQHNELQGNVFDVGVSVKICTFKVVLFNI